MIKATVQILGRFGPHAPFKPVWSQAVEVDGASVSVEPVVPANATGYELRVSVTPETDQLLFVVKVVPPDADAMEAPVEPVAVSRPFLADGVPGRTAPYERGSVVLCPVGHCP